MAVKELKNFLENGNIRNSVNYPNCDLGVCNAESRIAIYHRNIKKMIAQFADILEDTNIKNMSNTSKGDYAYTLVDLDTPVSESVVEQLREVEGVVKVRVIR
jgi:D-3-phosphoglycerate dehydrogenase